MALLRQTLDWWRNHINAEVDHPAVVRRVAEEAGWTPRFAFMVIMSAAIAELGLLQSSPAVVIGAMLISPLMSPIMGLGFGLALFDFPSLKRSLAALGIAVPLAVGFTVLIVLCSPLKSATPEILARTRPNLFDLVVALFSALAGTFALIRGKGDTIVGVAIATALMPPLATVGFGLATGNAAIAGGAFALFATNFVTIALSATIMARLYGFGHYLSSQQSWLQTGLLVAVFVVMAVPLGLSLQHIAREAVTTTQVRAALGNAAGKNARITQLDIDFQSAPLTIRAVLIVPRQQATPTKNLNQAIAARLHQPVDLQVDQVLIDPASNGLDETRAAVARAQDQQIGQQHAEQIAAMVALAAGVAPADVLIDREGQRAQVAARLLDGATLATYQALERRIADSNGGWTIAIVPPVGLPLAPVSPTLDDKGELSPAALEAIRLDSWAAKRWNWPALAVPGLPATAPPHPSPAQRAALAVARAVEAQGLAVHPAGSDHTMRLDLSSPHAARSR
jgi:uncharacterized hydrophobic protein (TIGR00271 family)